MKKMLLYVHRAVLMCVMGFTSALTYAQIVTIPPANTDGAGSSTVARKPFGNWWGYERSAMLYTPAEIGQPGTITALGFFVNDLNSPAASTPVKIYMKETGVADFNGGSTTYADEITGATLVFDGTVTDAELTIGQWVTKTLTTPFTYSGNQTLEVLVETNGGGGGIEGQFAKVFRISSPSSDYYFQYWQQDNSPPTGTGDVDEYRPNIQLNFAAALACSGTPVAGVTTTSSSPACPGQAFSLSLNGVTTDTGLTIQWMSSTDSVNYTNINGANSGLYNVAIDTPTYFRAVVTCNGSGLSDTSQPLLITVNTFLQCYCAPVTDCGSSDEITNVTFAGINNNTDCSPTGYSSYSSPIPQLVVGSSYPISVYVEDGGDENVGAWIDYDHSGTFDSVEFTLIGFGGGGATFSNTIAIPANAMPGITALRVRDQYGSTVISGNEGCNNISGYGETEDYLVEIQPATACIDPPMPGTISGTDTLCPNTPFTLSLTGQTPGTGLQWQTSADSMSWSDIAGATTNLYSDTFAMGPVYYRVRVTCADSTFTPTFTLSNSAPYLCACVSGIGGDCSGGDAIIENVSINSTTLNNSSDCPTPLNGSDYYTLFPDTGSATATLAQGVVYTLNVTLGDASIVSVWIDYNQNGEYEAAEWTQVTTNATSASVNFTVPVTAMQGQTGMRIRSRSTGSDNGAGDACSEFFSGETEDYVITIGPQPACTNPPSAGEISGDTTACLGSEVNLTLVNYTLGTALQWQVSTDSVNWNDVPGATLPTYTATVTDTVYYRVSVACVDTVLTGAFGITINPFLLCACEPSSDCSADDQITNVTFEGINNTTGCSNTGYSLYTSPAASVYPGGTFPISVEVGPGGTEYVSVWIDYNQNAEFETSEYTFLGTGNGSVVNNVITMPGNALLGTTRMRVRVVYNTEAGDTAACVDFDLGETEDYYVDFTTSPPCITPPVGGIVAGPTDAITDTAYLYTLTGSTGNIQWQYSVTDSTGPFMLVPGANDDSLFIMFGGTDTFYLRALLISPGCTAAYSNAYPVYAIKPGDNICGALPLAFGSNGPYDFNGATVQPNEPIPPAVDCNVQNGWCTDDHVLNGTMWFTFVAPASGRVRVHSPGFDTQLAVWEAKNCDSLTNGSATVLAANDDDDDYLQHNGEIFSSFVDSVICLTPGQTYYVQVDPYDQPDTTSIILTDLGAGPNAAFAALDTSYCTSQQPIVLAPQMAGGVFSGPGVSNDTFSAASAGPGGPYIITYAFYACYQTSDTINTILPAPVVSVDTIVNIICNGGNNGAVDITVTGPSPFTYAWANGATTEDLSGLQAGNYDPTVTGNNGCATTVPVEVTQPDTLMVNTNSITNVSCNGAQNGAIDIDVTGGVQPYSISWSGGQSTEDIANLTGGTYVPTVTDTNGCVYVGAPIVITEPDVLMVNVDSVWNVPCFGNGTGAVYVTVTGGTSPYTYNWSNNFQGDDNTGLSGGVYTLTVMDMNGCTATTAGDTVAEPSAALTLSLAGAQNVNCFGESTGSISVTTTGGTPAYHYTWSNAATTEDLSAVAAGNYALTVTDENACSATLSIALTQPASALSVTSTVTDQVQGGTAGSISLTAAGGTSPYTYSWSNSATTATISNLTAGVYTATVMDASGCMVTVRDTVDLVNGIAAVTTAFDVEVYPNPTPAQVTIDVKLPANQNVAIEIYNVNGQLEETLTRTNVLSAKFNINLGQKAEGIYIAKIKVGDETVVKRIIVTR